MTHTKVGCPDPLNAAWSRAGASALHAVEQAVTGLFSGDPAVAERVAKYSLRLSREQAAVEKLAAELLAGSAVPRPDPQWVLAVVRATDELVGVGRCASRLARRAATLWKSPDHETPEDLRMLANSVMSILQESLAIVEEPSAAGVLAGGDDVVDSLHRQIGQDVLMMLGNDASKAAAKLNVVLAAGELARIADHCARLAAEFTSVARPSGAERIAC